MAPTSWPLHFRLKEAIRSLRFGEFETIAEAAESYQLMRKQLSDELYLCHLEFPAGGKKHGERTGAQKRANGQQRFSKKEEQELVQEVLKDDFEPTNAAILALANSKLRKEDHLTRSWVRNFLGRNPDARKAAERWKNRPLPVSEVKPRKRRPNAPNRLFTEDQEELLADRIVDSNCTCYADMKDLVAEALDELGKDHDAIRDGWLYEFVKRHPECKSVVTRKSGQHYSVTSREDAGLTHHIETYCEHLHLGRVQEAEEIRQQIEAGPSDPDERYGPGKHDEAIIDVFIEVFYMAREGKLLPEDSQVCLSEPVHHEGEPVMIPVMPNDALNRAALIQKARKSMMKRRFGIDNSEPRTIHVEIENADAKGNSVSSRTDTDSEPASPSSSPMRPSDPDRQIKAIIEQRGAQKRARMGK